jgi:hypothetical protein
LEGALVVVWHLESWSIVTVQLIESPSLKELVISEAEVSPVGIPFISHAKDG